MACASAIARTGHKFKAHIFVTPWRFTQRRTFYGCEEEILRCFAALPRLDRLLLDNLYCMYVQPRFVSYVTRKECTLALEQS